MLNCIILKCIQETQIGPKSAQFLYHSQNNHSDLAQQARGGKGIWKIHHGMKKLAVDKHSRILGTCDKLSNYLDST
jgi:hypothetical protein